uniref:Exonuclease 1 n=1 Tax=Dunaliella tertiolecta TaxID=3047 RepID=A0A7S3QXM9_DUNTE|mmetsp:Transcript_22977/g.63464  ORF Transcript_22977/g.63464 Transcript_22977/m.63464 type:complete len:602 (-) Transcript_22977:198-2003(-)
MGIKDLLKRLDPIARDVSLREYKGSVLALDTSCLLHRRAALTPREHVLDSQDSNLIPTCMDQIRFLRKHGIEPILVFDGDALPMKAAEEEKRNRIRESSFKKACELEAAGDVLSAEKHWRAAAAVKPHHAKRLIEALKAEPVPFQFIVAPYEADAQCAYLALTKRVDAVITEDSDLLCYGCPRVLFKIDFWTGTAKEIRLEDLAKNDKPNFQGWDIDLFQEFCVLSGCDFLDNVRNRAIMHVHKGLNSLRSGLQYIKSLRMDTRVDVPLDYELSFMRARATFRHQLVYCPDRKECVHLTPLPEEGLRLEETVGISAGMVQVTTQADCDTKGGHQSSPISSSRGLISYSNSSSSSSSSSSTIGSNSNYDSIDISDFVRGSGLGSLEDSPLSFLGPMVPPDVAAAVARGDLDARTKQPFSPSTLTPTFTPELAKALGLRDAAEVRELIAIARSSVSTGSSRGGSSSGSSSMGSSGGGMRTLHTGTAASLPRQRARLRRASSFWEAAKGMPTETSLPDFSIRPPVIRKSRHRSFQPSRDVSPAALPCLPLHPHRSLCINKLSSSSSSSHIGSSRSSNGLGARPIIAIGHSLVRSAPMLLRRVLV